MACCPAHEDRHASLSVGVGDDDRVLVKCMAGCRVEDVVAALGLELSDLFAGRGGGAGIPPQPVQRCNTLPAAAAPSPTTRPRKGSTSRSSSRSASARSVSRVHRRSGSRTSTREASSCASGSASRLDGDLRVRTKAGMKHVLYGLNRLRQAREAGYVLLVEGESDTQTLWQAGYPALGLPGANGWNEDRDAGALDGLAAVYVLVEPDRGGEAVLRWIAASSIRERVRLVALENAKDVSELYLADRAVFRERIEAALQAAAPWAEHERIANRDPVPHQLERVRASSRASTDLLDKFARDVARDGLAGEERAAKLLYLIFVSRFLPRPVSAAVKGPSSGGKSLRRADGRRLLPWLRLLRADRDERARARLRDGAALASVPDPVRGRRRSTTSSSNYLVRSLLSEGRLRYETVEKTANGLEPKLIEREGPTGLITTTTKVALHPENETRLLSIPITDTPEQTQRRPVRARRRDRPGRRRPLDVDRSAGVARHRRAPGTVPYAKDLAELVPPVAVRLRRDFGALLALIRRTRSSTRRPRAGRAGGRRRDARRLPGCPRARRRPRLRGSGGDGRRRSSARRSQPSQRSRG